MEYEKLLFFLQQHPDSLSYWKRLLYTNLSAPKVKKNFAVELTSWYQRIIRAAVEKIEGWEKLSGYSHTCTFGCTYCCKQPIVIIKPEALVIYTYLKQNNLQKYLNKAVYTASIIRNQLPPPPPLNEKLIQQYRRQYFEANIPCPFLENNECVIYPVRPTNCATYYSYGNQQDCANDCSPKLAVQFNGAEHFVIRQILNFCNYNRKKASSEFFSEKIILLPLAIEEISS